MVFMDVQHIFGEKSYYLINFLNKEKKVVQYLIVYHIQNLMNLKHFIMLLLFEEQDHQDNKIKNNKNKTNKIKVINL